MLQPPKNMKYRKRQKGRNRGFFPNGRVVFGEFGLQAIGRGRLNARQIEAARRVMVRKCKRGAKIIIRVFPDKPISAKPLEVRQGKGKGNVDHYVHEVKPGTVLFEISGVDEALARESFRAAATKLPMKAQFIEHREL